MSLQSAGNLEIMIKREKTSWEAMAEADGVPEVS